MSTFTTHTCDYEEQSKLRICTYHEQLCWYVYRNLSNVFPEDPVELVGGEEDDNTDDGCYYGSTIHLAGENQLKILYHPLEEDRERGRRGGQVTDGGVKERRRGGQVTDRGVKERRRGGGEEGR